MKPRTKMILGVAAAAIVATLVVLGRGFFRGAAVGSVDAGPPTTPVTVFFRVRDPALVHAIPNMLELVDRMGDRLSVDAHVLSSAGDEDDALARCASKQGGVQALRFVVCRQSLGQGNDDWSACAEQSGLDRHVLDACAKGPEASTLAASATAEAARRGVTATPMFFVASHRVEGDGTRGALRRAVCDATRPAPDLCTEAPATAVAGFPIYVLTHPSCTECRAPFWFRRMQMLFPSADIRIVDVGSSAGRTQYDQIAPGLLPAVVLDGRVEGDPGFERIRRELVKHNDEYLLSPNTIHPAFDPTKTSP